MHGWAQGARPAALLTVLLGILALAGCGGGASTAPPAAAPAAPEKAPAGRGAREQGEVAKPPAAGTPSRQRPPTGHRPAATAAQAPPAASAGATPLAGMTISVDPGHNGGNFTHPEEIARPVLQGASGATKACNTTGTETDDGTLTEARFNWEVAQDLVRRLERLGATVVLTRRSNDGVGPCVNERAAIANRAHAAVALSIHADGNEAAGAHGFDVIHATTTEMVAPSMAGPSRRLAEDVRDALVEAGVPPANYVGSDGLDARSDLAGLNLARVPAVLVELGNMRDAEEASRLEDPAYRRRLADALAAGTVAFTRRG